LTPEEQQVVRLDLAIEQEFRLIVLKSYPDIADNVHDPSPHIGASLDDFRLRDWYQLNYRETLRDHEMGWGIDSSGSVYFVTQIRCKLQEKGREVEAWSLADLITNLDCTIEAAHRLWSYLNYPGEAHVLAELRVEARRSEIECVEVTVYILGGSHISRVVALRYYYALICLIQPAPEFAWYPPIGAPLSG